MALSIDLLEFLNANSYEQSMFRKAIYNSDKKLVSKLIKTHSSLKDQVLHVAAHLGNINILKEYIHAGAAWMSTRLEQKKRIVLHHSKELSLKINFMRKKVLLKFDADVNLSCNYFGDKVTPLYMAAKQNQLETVKVLLSRNANVQAITANRNQSVLHGAIPLASQEVVECLLSAGVDLNIVDSSYKTVVDLGRHTNYRLIPTIKEHLVKMKAAGLHLSERNLEVINHQEFDKVLDSCSKEVELMKKFRIAHTRVFFS
ncbi:hypothetical protein KQX54_007361 [Cotesia glomerata]|uniref:Uncharacterized protein n=1 Tax=Cotesia glomerata TaxID=32391 RepID=A0AAV7HXE5_COTGL|nr:hypothetical protein KQX54_007361 [Cotesia glomerata]